MGWKAFSVTTPYSLRDDTFLVFLNDQLYYNNICRGQPVEEVLPSTTFWTSRGGAGRCAPFSPPVHYIPSCLSCIGLVSIYFQFPAFFARSSIFSRILPTLAFALSARHFLREEKSIRARVHGREDSNPHHQLH